MYLGYINTLWGASSEIQQTRAVAPGFKLWKLLTDIHSIMLLNITIMKSGGQAAGGKEGSFLLKQKIFWPF